MATLPPLAGLPDIVDRLGQDQDVDEPRAWAVLADASSMVRTHMGRTWLDDQGHLLWEGSDDQRLQLVGDTITGVVCSAATRAYLNPTGKISETAGPFTYQLGDDAAEGLYLTDTERSSLDQAVDMWLGRAPGVWAMHTTRSRWPDTEPVARRFETTSTLFLDTVPDGDPIAWADPSDFT